MEPISVPFSLFVSTILTIGFLSFLALKLLNGRIRLDRWTKLLGSFYLVSLLVFLLGYVTNFLTTTLGTSAPPHKYSLERRDIITLDETRQCLSMLETFGQASFTATLHSKQGFIIHISGKDILLAQTSKGHWERISFFMDLEIVEQSMRIQFVNIWGTSTNSNLDTLPSIGDRWEPFNAQEFNNLLANLHPIFTSIVHCLDDELDEQVTETPIRKVIDESFPTSQIWP